jgi:hypothetical protein
MLQTRLEEGGRDLTGSTSPVFPSTRGTFIWPNNAHRAWREARAQVSVDISWLIPHNLRKTVGTAAAQAAGVVTAAAMLGHTPKVFEQYYLDQEHDAVDATHALDTRLAPFETSTQSLDTFSTLSTTTSAKQPQQQPAGNAATERDPRLACLSSARTVSVLSRRHRRPASASPGPREQRRQLSQRIGVRATVKPATISVRTQPSLA